MKYGLSEILTLAGSLGLFLFGMKMMSEALQKVAGDRMRLILAKMTSNRVKGVLTGILITAVIQSSSATTVMIVSFVNAGLLSLMESVGVIMGANVGTTVTAWIISVLGFKIHMNQIAIPIIGISMVLYFSKKDKRKSWGEFLIGFAILFLGLEYLKTSMPSVDSGVLEFLSNYVDMGYGSILIFILIGAILTLLIQSSSATMALTLVMCNEGLIPFDMAAAMVLGQNIGTTITANLAALIANNSAKRAAIAHLLFNVFGVILALILFYPMLNLIDNIVVRNGGFSAFDPSHPEVVPITLSIFHTVFNILNTLILIWFTKYLVKIVIKLVPSKEDEEEEFKLQYIDSRMVSTAEISVFQARKEIAVYGNRTKRMFGLVRELFAETNEKKFDKLHKRIAKYEDISDRMEIEISTYLTKISESELSHIASERIRAMLKMISDIESISDSCYNLSMTIKRKRKNKVWFIQEKRDKLKKMFDLIDMALKTMNENLEKEYSNVNIDRATDIENDINSYRDRLRKEHFRDIKDGKYEFQPGTIYNDIFCESEKLGDYVINVSEAITDSNN